MTDQEKDFMKVLGLSDENPTDQQAVKGKYYDADPSRQDQRKQGYNKNQGIDRNKETNRTNGNRTPDKSKEKVVTAKPEPTEKVESSWRCLNLPEPLYRRIRALSYYLTLSGDGTTVSMAQAISRAMEAYLSDDPRAGKFIGEYDQGMTPRR